MKKIEVTVKGRNGRIKFELAHDAYLVKLETAQAKGSTGIYGDYLEAIIRHLWKKAGLTPSDFRVHHSDERDALNRKNGGLEVKTGHHWLHPDRDHQRRLLQARPLCGLLRQAPAVRDAGRRARLCAHLHPGGIHRLCGHLRVEAQGWQFRQRVQTGRE